MKNTHFLKPVFVLLMMVALMAGCEETEEQYEALNLQIGKTSESGGLVFYDKGEYSNGWRYIEAAPEDINGPIEWGCYNTSVAGAKNSEVGMGKANTEAIINFHDALDNFYSNPSVCNDNSNGTVAAKAVSQLVINGYSDWYLPSKEEARLMYCALYLKGLGNFDNGDGNTGPGLYWTSTERTDNSAATIDFSNGCTKYSCKKCSDNTKIRAIRYF